MGRRSAILLLAFVFGLGALALFGSFVARYNRPDASPGNPRVDTPPAEPGRSPVEVDTPTSAFPPREARVPAATSSQMRPVTVRVRSSVVDRLGRPVLDARVSLVSGENPTEIPVDANGHFETDVAPWSQSVFTARAPGLVTLRPTEFRFSRRGNVRRCLSDEDWPAEAEIAPIVLAPPCNLVGRLVTRTGEPIPDTLVELRGGVPSLYAHSNGDGRFRFDGMAEGNYGVLVAFATDFSQEFQPVAVLADEVNECTVVLERETSLVLRVDLATAAAENERLRDELQASPFAACSSSHRHRTPDPQIGTIFVRCASWDGWRSHHLSAESTTIAPLSAGEVLLVVKTPGWTGTTRLTVAVGERAEATITLERAPQLRGAIRDSKGQPLAKKRVAVRSVENGIEGVGTTDDEGAFTFNDLPAGRYNVAIREGLREDDTEDAPLAEGLFLDGSTPVLLTVPETTRLELHLVEDGTGRRLVPEHLSHSQRPWPRSWPLDDWHPDDADASIALLRVAPAWIAVMSSDRALVTRVDVSPGENRVTLSVPHMGSLKVRVLTPSGTPVDVYSGVKLTAIPVDIPDVFHYPSKVEVRSDGFLFRDLPRGRYRIATEERTLLLLARRLGVARLELEPVEVTVDAGQNVEREVTLKACAR